MRAIYTKFNCKHATHGADVHLQRRNVQLFTQRTQQKATRVSTMEDATRGLDLESVTPLGGMQRATDHRYITAHVCQRLTGSGRAFPALCFGYNPCVQSARLAAQREAHQNGTQPDAKRARMCSMGRDQVHECVWLFGSFFACASSRQSNHCVRTPKRNTRP